MAVPVDAPSAPRRRAPWIPELQSLDIRRCKILGRGAFGEVLLVRAKQLTCGADVSGVPRSGLFALKRAPLTQVSDAGLEQAKAEAKLLQKLGEEHESILRCFDARIILDPDPVFELLLEFAPLGDLCSRIRHCREQTGLTSVSLKGLPEAEVVVYACDVASGLAHIHSLTPMVLHRDVKPANVVLFPSADVHGVPRAKLADFGIAKVLEANGSFAGAATVIGTPHYFSPELCRGERYDERSDAWALGCVIYEMLCLHRPFHQAEGNIVTLTMRVMRGLYDKEALEQRADCYNGLLVWTLTRLLSLEPEQRCRAADAGQSLLRLRGAALAPCVAWWESDEQGERPGSPDCPVTDSWMGAMRLDPEQVCSQLQEVTLRLDAAAEHAPAEDATLSADSPAEPEPVEDSPLSRLACMGLMISEPPSAERVPPEAQQWEQMSPSSVDLEREALREMGESSPDLVEEEEHSTWRPRWASGDDEAATERLARVFVRPLETPGQAQRMVEEDAPMMFYFSNASAAPAFSGHVAFGASPWVEVQISAADLSALYVQLSQG